jgi:hypothetical protein
MSASIPPLLKGRKANDEESFVPEDSDDGACMRENFFGGRRW